MNGVFGQIQITQQSDERRQDASRLRTIKRIRCFADWFVRGFQSQSKLAICRTSNRAP